MATKIKISDLDKELKNMLKEYGDEILDDMSKAVIQTADESVDKLKGVLMPSATSMGNSNPSKRRQWNKYAKGWESYVKLGTDYAHATVHNRKYPKLTHLLEYGHATRDGKRTRAFEHIAPVDEWASNTFAKKANKNIGG